MEARGPPRVPKWSPRTPKMEPLRPPETPKWSQNDSKTQPKSLSLARAPQKHQKHIHIRPPTSQRTNFVSIFINKPKHMHGQTYTVPSANQPSHKPTRQQASQKEFYIACVFYRDTYASIILCLQQIRPLCFDLGPATRTTTVPVAIQDILAAQRHQHWASGAERRT